MQRAQKTCAAVHRGQAYLPIHQREALYYRLSPVEIRLHGEAKIGPSIVIAAQSEHDLPNKPPERPELNHAAI